MFSGGFLQYFFGGYLGSFIFEPLLRLPSLSAVQQDYALSLQELSRRSVQDNRVAEWRVSISTRETGCLDVPTDHWFLGVVQRKVCYFFVVELLWNQPLNDVFHALVGHAPIDHRHGAKPAWKKGRQKRQGRSGWVGIFASHPSRKTVISWSDNDR